LYSRLLKYNGIKHYSSAPHRIESIGIIGAGQMGAGIAQVASQVAKVNVMLVDLDSKTLKSSMDQMESLLKKMYLKERLKKKKRKRFYQELKQLLILVTCLMLIL